MKVNLFVSRDIEEPHADIHTNELTDNITKAMSILESDDTNEILAVKNGSDITLLQFDDVFMLRVENKQVKVYAENNEYLIRKPLYQKTTIVNLKKIKRVAPSLKGMMFIELKNGLKDNISRKYLPDFKNALDL